MPDLPEIVHRMLEGETYHPPVAKLIGFRLTDVGPGEARVVLEAGEEHANPMGTLHGGILCDIADAAMGLAHAASLKQGETFTTLGLQIQFLRPHWTGELVADASHVKRGRTISVLEATVRDEEDRGIARATSTVMT
ncbi:MAG: PaaI family thioesterase, partial [Candidatus Thermoplasmatota archaeon]|nr:PaaI family thioesterase [Candidatus Thermoplasmatota archaeon]